MKRHFRSQLDFASVIKLCATLGFGFGILFGLVFLLSGLQSGQGLQAVMAFLLSPLFSAAGNVVTGLVGYPFYVWYCNKIRGQRISGKFMELSNTQQQNDGQ